MIRVQFKLQNFLFYTFGAFSIAFGVIFMLRSNLGTSTWDTLHYALSQLLDIEIGDATIVVALFFTVLVIALNKNFKYIFMAIPIFVVGFLINYINLDLLGSFTVTTIFGRIGSYLLGLLLLPLGGSLLIVSTFPAGVFDEFNLAVMRVLKTDKLVLIRVIMEISAVLTAFIIGVFANDPQGMINIGTIIFSVTVGSFLKTYLNIFERIGLYENKQND